MKTKIFVTLLLLQFLTSSYAQQASRIGHVNKYGRDAKIYILDDGFIPDVIAMTCEGGLFGKIYDTAGQPIAGASILVFSNDTAIVTTKANSDGDYHFIVPRPGRYAMTIKAAGKHDSLFTIRVVPGNDTTIVDFTLADGKPYLWTMDILALSPAPMITFNILKQDAIKPIPSTSITDLPIFYTGIYQNRRNLDVSCDGGRTTGNLYIIDGMVALTGQ